MKGKAMWIITNDRVTPKVYLHVVSCLPIPSGYCGNESLKFPPKWCATRKNNEQKLLNFTFHVIVQLLQCREVTGTFIMMEEVLIKIA